MKPATPPTVAQCTDWLARIAVIMKQADQANIHHGLYQVPARIYRERTDFGSPDRTIEGGCASRLMRVTQSFRASGFDPDPVVALAREIIQHECLPSPGWRTLCEEYGVEFIATETEND